MMQPKALFGIVLLQSSIFRFVQEILANMSFQTYITIITKTFLISISAQRGIYLRVASSGH